MNDMLRYGRAENRIQTKSGFIRDYFAAAIQQMEYHSVSVTGHTPSLALSHSIALSHAGTHIIEKLRGEKQLCRACVCERERGRLCEREREGDCEKEREGDCEKERERGRL